MQNDPLIGLKVVGSYVIRAKLAEGGMGAVYVAVNTNNHRKVVKVMLPELSANPALRERFDREARAVARLKGRPHIVDIDDVGELATGQQFMTMEFLHGKPLDVHLRQSGRLPPHEAFHLVLQIGRGLHELHSEKLIHRDLKPGNVFITNKHDNPNHVVLIDLGIAHDATLTHQDPAMRTQTGAAMGTPGYMAPEQFTEAGTVTPAADIYALAGILWEMLCGQPPWGFADPRVLYFKQRTEIPVFPPDVIMPEAWRPTLLAALSPNPIHRPQIVYAFLAALASELPPDESRSLPGGAEMMSSFARSLIKNAPADSETVRVHGAPRLGAMLWTPAGRGSSEGQPHTVNLSGVPAPIGPATLASATVNERAAAVRAQTPSTTLAASSGVAVLIEHPKSSRVLLAAGIAGLMLVVGVLMFVVARGVANRRATPPQPTSAEQATDTPNDASAPTPSRTAPATGAPADAPLSADAGLLTSHDAGAPADAIEPALVKDARTATPDASIRATPKRATTPTTPREVNAPPQGSGATFDPDAVEE